MDVDCPTPTETTTDYPMHPVSASDCAKQFGHWSTCTGYQRLVILESCQIKETFFRLHTPDGTPPTKGRLIAKIICRLQAIGHAFTQTQNALLCDWIDTILSDAPPLVKTLRVSQRKMGATTVLSFILCALLETIENAVIEIRCIGFPSSLSILRNLPLRQGTISQRSTRHIVLRTTHSEIKLLAQPLDRILDFVKLLPAYTTYTSVQAAHSSDLSVALHPHALQCTVGFDVKSQTQALAKDVENLYLQLRDRFPDVPLYFATPMLASNLNHETDAFAVIYYLMHEIEHFQTNLAHKRDTDEHRRVMLHCGTFCDWRELDVKPSLADAILYVTMAVVNMRLLLLEVSKE